MKNSLSVVIVMMVVVLSLTKSSQALQSWQKQPEYQEVNPGGTVVLECRVEDMRGECSWEKDGTPVGLYPDKYVWAGLPEQGDCSLRIYDAQLEYDDGVWQCQVTASSFRVKDALVSQGAELIVRESPTDIFIQKIGDAPGNITASEGEEVELECIVTGGNPPAKINWFVQDRQVTEGFTQANERVAESSRTWRSVSRLTLPVSRREDKSIIRCQATHPTLDRPMASTVSVTIHYRPAIRIDTTSLANLEEHESSVTIRCLVDSNPPATVLWRKKGLVGIFSNHPEITISPVSRDTAGNYSCVAENALGSSDEVSVLIDVNFAPSIVSVGPSRVVQAKMSQRTVLSCKARGNPPPQYQWLQRRPANEGVLIRGYSQELIIDNVTYEHQGEFVCEAKNEINGKTRTVQSEPIKIEVSGAPQVMKYSTKQEVRVQNGQDAVLEVHFCANPLPRQDWDLGRVGGSVILTAGTAHGRFLAEKVQQSSQEDCYVSVLRINGAHADDSHAYALRLTNSHGTDSHVVHLIVKDYVSQDFIIAGVVGAILTLLLIILVCVYCCKSGSASSCCSSEAEDKKMNNFKPADLESDRTDIESTHSSNLSGYPNHHDQQNKQLSKSGHAGHNNVVAIPPDALYATSEKHRLYQQQQRHMYIHDAVFNDSKESLRPDMNPSNLNRTNSSSGDLNVTQRISYNDLCFPKTSNYGSMKKKSRGVDCRLGGAPGPRFYPVTAPSPALSASPVRTYY